MALILAACGDGEVVEEAELTQEEVATEEVVEESTFESDDHSTIASNSFYEPFEGKLDHLHGLGYAGNQDAIFFATHTGIKVYEDGQWYQTIGQNNDYMGFNAVDKGFYTSGHPGVGVDLPDPIGLKRSFDNGQTLEDLGLEGESDFHVMAVGFKSHIVYVFNEFPNSKFSTGLFVTKDNGESWTELRASNLGSGIFSLATHPTDEHLVAAVTNDGIFFSEDGGESFNLLTLNQQGTSVFFSDNTLWYGAFGQEPTLVKYSLDSGEEEQILLPKLVEDAVMYLAQNPKKPNEIVFTTFDGHVYISNDGGNSWDQLAENGLVQ